VAKADGSGRQLNELDPDGASGVAAAQVVLAEKAGEDRIRDCALEFAPHERVDDGLPAGGASPTWPGICGQSRKGSNVPANAVASDVSEAVSSPRHPGMSAWKLSVETTDSSRVDPHFGDLGATNLKERAPGLDSSRSAAQEPGGLECMVGQDDLGAGPSDRSQ
jgi:hypothetical protein